MAAHHLPKLSLTPAVENRWPFGSIQTLHPRADTHPRASDSRPASVPAGAFTADHDSHAASLAGLKTLADAVGAEVFLGHELDGTGTGVDEVVAAR